MLRYTIPRIWIHSQCDNARQRKNRIHLRWCWGLLCKSASLSVSSLLFSVSQIRQSKPSIVFDNKTTTTATTTGFQSTSRRSPCCRHCHRHHPLRQTISRLSQEPYSLIAYSTLLSAILKRAQSDRTKCWPFSHCCGRDNKVHCLNSILLNSTQLFTHLLSSRLWPGPRIVASLPLLSSAARAVAVQGHLFFAHQRAVAVVLLLPLLRRCSPWP